MRFHVACNSLSARLLGTTPAWSAAYGAYDGKLHEHYVAARRYGDPGTMTPQETVRADHRQVFDRASA
jgi:hypothetical protein